MQINYTILWHGSRGRVAEDTGEASEMYFEIAETTYSEPEPWQEEPQYEPCDECGGRVVATGGHHHYNGYTLYLDCENCGPYEVECV